MGIVEIKVVSHSNMLPQVIVVNKNDKLSIKGQGDQCVELYLLLDDHCHGDQINNIPANRYFHQHFERKIKKKEKV